MYGPSHTNPSDSSPHMPPFTCTFFPSLLVTSTVGSATGSAGSDGLYGAFDCDFCCRSVVEVGGESQCATDFRRDKSAGEYSATHGRFPPVENIPLALAEPRRMAMPTPWLLSSASHFSFLENAPAVTAAVAVAAATVGCNDRRTNR